MKFSAATVLAFAFWALPTMAMPQNGTSSNILEKRLGINCRGSGMCNGLCGAKLKEVIAMVKKIDNFKAFENGEHIACKRCDSCTHCRTHPSLCVFPQNLTDGQKVSAKRVKKALRELQEHGCTMCGSNPIHGHNDVKLGEITVNYVTMKKDPEEPKESKEPSGGYRCFVDICEG